ncbi:hypothetical protein PSN_5483 [Pseudomonas sp. NGC7]
MKIQHSRVDSPILYGNNKPLVDLYCHHCQRACLLHGIN